MGDSPKPITSSDGSDTEALIRVAVTPGPGIRPKRSSIVNSASQSGSGLDAVPTAEDLLVETLLAIEGDDISYDVFQFVLEMMEEISKNYLPGQSCRDIFGVIFSLLTKAVPPIQSRVVATINQMILSNPTIVQYTKDTEWLSSLLAYIPRFEDSAVLDELFKLIEILGSYSISVKQVKMIFKLFQVEDTGFKSYYWQNIFPLLQRLWHGRDGRPNDYFELDGYNSGLLLPGIKLPSGGYSIATWVNVGSFSSNYTRDAYQPYLFSFLTEDGTSGIEAHFNRGKLVLRTNPAHSNTSKREMRIINYDFAENRWYFLALTHAKKLILSDECTVYVNGESVQHFNLKYPKPEQALKASRLGTAGAIPEAKSCMRGKLAGFLAFDDTLNADEVRALYQHGPNLFSSLWPLEQLVLMPRSRLARRPNVLFFYSPRATDVSVCLEPWSNDATRRANMLPGVKCCITTGFQDSLSSVGGIQLFLPLFSSKYRPASGELVDVNTKVLSLLIELVTDNEDALTEMLRSKFFQLMGYLLATDFNQQQTPSQQQQNNNASMFSASTANVSSIISETSVTSGSTPQPSDSVSGTASTHHQKGKASSNKWSPQSIEVLDQLALAVSKFGATNANKTNGPLFEQFFRHVYLNFHIWTNADYEVQLALLKSINTHVKRDPELFHTYLSVSQLMTILNEHFTYNPQHEGPAPSSFGDSSFPSHRTTALIPNSLSTNSSSYQYSRQDWSKRPRAQLMELRKALLGTLHCFIQAGITLKETKSIVNYLHHEVNSKPEERRLITDVLQVLLIAIGEKHASLLHHINTLGNLLIFLPLLKAENEKFRVWTLKVIGKLIQNADVEPGHKDSIMSHLPSLRKALEPYPFSIHTYNVLLEILIDSVSADGLLNPVDLALHPSTPPASVLTNMKNLKMISVIFHLLNARSDTELRIKVLKDFLFYLKRGAENRVRFTSQHDWQAWILSLLVPDQPSSNTSPVPSGKVPSTAGANSSTANAPSSGNSNAVLIATRRLHSSRSGAAKPPPLNASVPGSPIVPHHVPSVSEAAAYNVLLGLVTELFSLIFETVLLQQQPGINASTIFEGTSAVLRRMSSIKNVDAISIANTINTKVLKMMAENNIVAKCKASALAFQTCVQYLTFVESTFFRTPPTASPSVIATPSTPLNVSKDTISRDAPSTPSNLAGTSEITNSVTASPPSSGSNSIPFNSFNSFEQASLRSSASAAVTPLKHSASLAASLTHSSSFGSVPFATPSNRPLTQSQSLQSMGSQTPMTGEKDTIRFGDRALLPLQVHYGTNGSWISFTLAQRILDLVDQLVMNKIERTPTLEIAPELLDRLEATLSRFRTRLVLYSIAEGATFRSTARLRVRKESIRNIRQVIYDGFTSATSKSLSGSEMPSGGVHASLARYLSKKTKQWDTEMSDVDAMFHKNIKRMRALIESTPSTHAALYLIAYIGALVQKANASPQAQLQHQQTQSTLAPSSSMISTPGHYSGSSSHSPTSTTPHHHSSSSLLLQVHQSAGSSPNILMTPSKDTTPSSISPSASMGSVMSPSHLLSPAPGSPSNSRGENPSVQQTDESILITQQLWRDGIQNIRQRLSGDSNYGSMFSKLDGDVLLSFFDGGFASPKDFVLSPAIEKAIDFIVTNDLNAMNATQAAMKAVAERYTDITQEETLRELEAHKLYELEWTAQATANTAAEQESSTLYGIRHSQYISIVAGQWKNFLRVLLDTRGPWSSPYTSPGYETGDRTTLQQTLQLSSANQLSNTKLYWKLDPTENSQRMRLKLKRHYGDTTLIEFASARNDDKERLLIESLQSSSGSLGGTASPMSPNGSFASLPAFEQLNAASTSPATASNLNRAELLKLVARRGNATALDEDEAGLIDTEFGVGVDDEVASNSSSSSTQSTASSATASTSSTSTPASVSSTTASSSTAFPTPKSSEERTLLLTTCEYVKGIATVPGDFEVTNLNVYFRNFERGIFKMIPLEKLRMIYARRYMLRNTALELFTTDRTSHFFNFDRESPAKVLKVIVDRRPSNLREYFAGSSQALARKKKHITEAWRKRQISNFEYLMELNTIAGRSYSDLSQYPVFPWIIADYESERIDLNNPAIYRDLSKPIGALDEARLEKFLARWDEMVKNSDENASTPPFLYGSHYSSHSIVLYYLLRLEPFTSQSLELQGGAFDLPARLFTSIPEAWKNCLINQSDVKELIPEFFFLPSFLHDTNDINIGCLKPAPGIGATPISIDTVQLPPWANSPQSFVQMNRLALESDYVSAHLHEWIDLIFGFKQLGQDAIDAHNVFYYTSYEGNIDIVSISDPMLKQSVQMQIREFGQTPSQLFTSPHPVRLTLEESQKAKKNALANLVASALNAGAEPEWKPTTADLGKTVALQMRPNTVANAEIVSIHVDCKNERFVIVFMDGLVQTVNWKIPRGKRFPLTLTPQWAEADVISAPQKREEHSLENTASAPGLNPSQTCFAYLDSSKILINGGSWDRSISISMVTSNLTALQSISEHKDVVTCVAVTSDHEQLITGSRDCNVLVWEVDSFSLKKKISTAERDLNGPRPKFVLFGHDDAINCVAVNNDINVIVTASQDCTAIVYDLRKGHYVRTIVHDAPVTLVALSKYGDIVTYCNAGELLYLHSINGTLLQRLSGVGKLTALKFSGDGQLIVSSGQNVITVRSIFQYSLKRVYVWKCPTAVSAIELFNQDEYLLIGLCDGTLLSVLFDMNRLLTDMSREMAMEKHD